MTSLTVAESVAAESKRHNEEAEKLGWASAALSIIPAVGNFFGHIVNIDEVKRHNRAMEKLSSAQQNLEAVKSATEASGDISRLEQQNYDNAMRRTLDAWTALGGKAESWQSAVDIGFGNPKFGIKAGGSTKGQELVNNPFLKDGLARRRVADNDYWTNVNRLRELAGIDPVSKQKLSVPKVPTSLDGHAIPIVPSVVPMVSPTSSTHVSKPKFKSVEVFESHALENNPKFKSKERVMLERLS